MPAAAAMTRRRGWPVTLAAVAVVAIGLRLGFWQLDRAAQKVALQRSIDERRALPALDAHRLPDSPAAADAGQHRGVVVEGRWRPDATVYLENRPIDGRPGFVVVTPLVLADGRTLAVQRGWLPRDPADRTRIADHRTPAGTIIVRGRIVLSPPRLLELAASSPGAIRQNLDLDAYGRELRTPLLPFIVLEEDGGDAGADGLVRRWPAPAVDVHKHYGYAFQWFALSGLVIVLHVWFRIVRPRRRA